MNILNICQSGLNITVKISTEDLKYLNERRQQLLQEDPSWKGRNIEIYNMVMKELKSKQK